MITSNKTNSNSRTLLDLAPLTLPPSVGVINQEASRNLFGYNNNPSPFNPLPIHNESPPAQQSVPNPSLVIILPIISPATTNEIVERHIDLLGVEQAVNASDLNS